MEHGKWNGNGDIELPLLPPLMKLLKRSGLEQIRGMSRLFSQSGCVYVPCPDACVDDGLCIAFWKDERQRVFKAPQKTTCDSCTDHNTYKTYTHIASKNR